MLKIKPRDFKNIIFFTGAGMSKESGIDTYRGEGGIWDRYNWNDYACQRAFLKSPEKVLNFHELRRKEIFYLNPHEGYDLISEIQKKRTNTHIITQNIDGLHKKALSNNILELHGNLWSIRCENENRIIQDDENWYFKKKICDCGNYLRPNIIWFEDG